MWIDTHCHLDAAEFDEDRDAVRQRAREAGVGLCVIPAVERAHWSAVQALAHRHADAYALGIHPLYVPQAHEDDLQALDDALTAAKDDLRLVAVGEIGLDFFVPALCEPAMRERQWRFYVTQLQLARKHGLPVILHVRRSADLLLKGLRQVGVSGGIAHAFNGSAQQAQAFIDLGFALGFGGAMTFERATALRELARTLPLEALVLETELEDHPAGIVLRRLHVVDFGVDEEAYHRCHRRKRSHAQEIGHGPCLEGGLAAQGRDGHRLAFRPTSP